MKKLIQFSLPVIAVFSLATLSSTVYASAQEAVDLHVKMTAACNDKDEGDICDFTNDKGESINGQCHRTGSSDAKLSCTPTN